MTMKSLLLGAAAGIVAVGGAQAADLPMEKAEAVEYVRVCSEFGAGFFFIPGTDTCLKIGGEVRTEFGFFDRSPGTATASDANNLTGFSGRARLEFDARTSTSMGPLRSFIAIQQTFGNGGAGAMELDRAFIRFGGFVAGLERTFFVPAGMTTQDGAFGGDAGLFDAGRPLFGYVANFGGGFAAALSIESMATGDAGTSAGVMPAGVTVTNKGQELPDIVASLAYSSGAVSASISAAIHQNNVFDSNAALPAYGDASKVGYAIGAGLQFALAPATIAVYGAYADGAVRYTGLSTALTDDIHVSDVAAAFSLSSSTAYRIGASLGFAVSPQVSLGFGGAYSSYDAPVGAATIDFTQYNIYANAAYTVVPGFTASLSGGYTKTDFDPVGVTDVDNWSVGVRVARSF